MSSYSTYVEKHAKVFKVKITKCIFFNKHHVWPWCELKFMNIINYKIKIDYYYYYYKSITWTYFNSYCACYNLYYGNNEKESKFVFLNIRVGRYSMYFQSMSIIYKYIISYINWFSRVIIGNNIILICASNCVCIISRITVQCNTYNRWNSFLFAVLWFENSKIINGRKLGLNNASSV